MTEAQMLKKLSETGSFYAFRKDGSPDRRYKLAKEMEAKYGAGLHIVNQAKRKDVQAIAETPKRRRVQKIKKTSFLDRITGFFKVLFIFATVIAIPLSYALTER